MVNSQRQMTIEEVLRSVPEQVDITSRKHRGNPNSQAASQSTNRDRDCARIVAHLEQVGSATTWEVSVALNMGYTTASARMADLRYRHKSIVETGSRRPTGTGSLAAVMRLRVEGDRDA